MKKTSAFRNRLITMYITFLVILVSFLCCQKENYPVYENNNKLTLLSIDGKEVTVSSLYGSDTQSDLFYHSNSYRIPCIVSTIKNDILIATADIRYDSPGDRAKIEVGVCRSFDGGKTWQDYGIIFHRDENINKFNRVYDCALSVDRNISSAHHGRIWAFAKMAVTDLPEPEWNKSDLVYLLSSFSDDNGLTWSKPIDLTHLFPGGAFHVSSGVTPGITLKNGTLVQPVYYARWENGRNMQRASFLYSDDSESWKLGPLTPGPAGENSIIQLSDESLLMNARDHYFDYSTRRVYTLDPHQGVWVNRTDLETIKTVSCQESLVYWNGIYLYSQPTGYLNNSGRTQITIFKSKDLKTWEKFLQITDNRYCYGYSTIILNDKVFGIIYESEAPLHEIKFMNLTNLLPSLYN